MITAAACFLNEEGRESRIQEYCFLKIITCNILRIYKLLFNLLHLTSYM